MGECSVKRIPRGYSWRYSTQIRFGCLLCYNENLFQGAIKLRSNIVERAYGLGKKKKKEKEERQREREGN